MGRACAGPAKSVGFGHHLHRVAIENGARMVGGDPFHRHTAFIEKRGQHMGMHDRVAGFCLWAEPAYAILVPDPPGTHGKRMPTIGHRQASAKPAKLVANRLSDRARPQGIAHVKSGVEKSGPHTGARDRTGRNKTKIHDNHAAQAGTDQPDERQSPKVSGGKSG